MLKIKLFPILLIASIFLSGCAISFNTGATTNDSGGVLVTIDKGNTWKMKTLIPTVTGKPRSIGALDINQLVMDPNDNKALYFASLENGLYFTYDQAESWNVSQNLGKVNVKALAVDPLNKCIIYAASGNKLYRSLDCARTWVQVYYDNDQLVAVTSIAIDHYNSANVYLSLSRGDILKSNDRGATWHAINRLDTRIEKLIISPSDSRVVFVCTRDKGIFRSLDSGETWSDLSNNLKDYKDSKRFRDLAVSRTEPGLVILANNYGLLRSRDNGNNWEKIELITPEKEAIINTVALGAKTTDDIYYVTNTTFYRTADAGKNWASKKLPTTRAGWQLIVDPENDRMIYMAVRAIKN